MHGLEALNGLVLLIGNHFDQLVEVVVVSHRHIGNVNPCHVVGHALGPHPVKLRLYRRVGRRGNHPKFHAIA